MTQAPAITLTTLDGAQIHLADLRGRPVLVNFWATTCPGCVKEMPDLVALHKDMAAKGVAVIGVAMSYDMPNQVVQMTQERQIPYPVALDPMGEAAHAFGDVMVVPTSFLIAPDRTAASPGRSSARWILAPCAHSSRAGLRKL